VGKGACFKIFLPCCAEKTDRLHTRLEIKGGRRLLDDEESLINCRRSLEKLGYQVTGETSSVRALKKFSENPQQFDLIVTDQTMPQLTGLLLAQEIWKIRPGLPVIISTGYSEQITSEIASNMGFHTF
jgi:CheY-like chemotaxis protein